MLNDCLRKLPSRPDDLLVLDSNFGFFNTVSRLDKQGRPFCIRMSSGITDFGKSVMKDSRMDFITEWVPTRTERETAGNSDPVRARVSRAMLETGETELLVSSLKDMESFKAEKSLFPVFIFVISAVTTCPAPKAGIACPDL